MSPWPSKTDEGGAAAPPAASPSTIALRWLLGLRLVVVSTLFLGVLIIQLNTQLGDETCCAQQAHRVFPVTGLGVPDQP